MGRGGAGVREGARETSFSLLAFCVSSFRALFLMSTTCGLWREGRGGEGRVAFGGRGGGN